MAYDKCVKDIISSFQDLVWTECSGAVEYLWKTYSDGWLRIPNTYLPIIFGPKVFNSNKFKLIESHQPAKLKT